MGTLAAAPDGTHPAGSGLPTRRDVSRSQIDPMTEREQEPTEPQDDPSPDERPTGEAEEAPEAETASAAEPEPAPEALADEPEPEADDGVEPKK